MDLVMVAPSQLDAFAEHIYRIVRESGTEGRLISTPREPGTGKPIEEIRKKLQEGWSRGLDEAGWSRSWAVFDGELAIGHLELHGGRLPAEMHRATLGMGIEGRYHRRGLGRRLIDTAVQWARDQGLAWIDLGVFAHNEPARRLYEQAGFESSGTTLDDIRMSLRL